MISGSIRWIVVQLNDVGGVVAIWGPFPSEEEADNWEGIPGTSMSMHKHPMRSAPQWLEGLSVDEESG
jgi:hypothetical protein